MDKKTLKAMAVAKVKGEQISSKAQSFIASSQQRLQQLCYPPMPEFPSARAAQNELQTLRSGAKSAGIPSRIALLSPIPLRCYRCRQELARGRAFCSRCGAKIKGVRRLGGQFPTSG